MSSYAVQSFQHLEAIPYASLMGKPDEREKIGFGERLKKAREELHLSGAELGKGLQPGKGEEPDSDASRQSVNDWEAERHYPTVWQLRKLCEKLHRTADFLLFGKEAVSGLTPEAARIAFEIDALPIGDARDRVLEHCQYVIGLARSEAAASTAQKNVGNG